MHRIVKIFTIIVALISFYSTSGAVTPGNISGFVYDKRNGEAMISANIYLKGTNIGASTNTSGFYSIPKVPFGKYTLVCQYIGYETFSQDVSVQANKEVKIDIFLVEEALLTEEIVVSADSIRTVQRLYNKPISEIRLDPKQINRIPQVAEADLLRSLQTLPGIMPISGLREPRGRTVCPSPKKKPSTSTPSGSRYSGLIQTLRGKMRRARRWSRCPASF